MVLYKRAFLPRVFTYRKLKMNTRPKRRKVTHETEIEDQEINLEHLETATTEQVNI